MEKRIYRETPLKIAVRVVFGVIGLFIVIGIFVSFLPAAPMTPAAKTAGVISIAAVLVVMFGTLLIAWLAIKRRVVTIDQSGVEVAAKRPFGRAADVVKLSWQDVTGVRLRSQTWRVKNSEQTNYLFAVTTKDKTVDLMTRTFLTDELKNLVRDVSRATAAQLGYSWEECRADETRPVLEAVPPFCKIALNETAATEAKNNLSAPTAPPTSSAAAEFALRASNSSAFQPVPMRAAANPAVPKQQTKKQLRKSAVIFLVIGLALSLGAIGFAYWDYREQVKFYNFWERGSGFDFKTGNPIPNYQPPPFVYRYDRMVFLPYIIIFGAVSLLFATAGISEFRKSQKMVETPEMRAADAEREALENSPQMKSYARRQWILFLAPVAVLVPIPFMAIYKLGVWVFLGYIIFAAIFVGALYVILPRRL